ncbi:hypothetical protein JCM8202_003589 [Rhodotorula sphaerocarpa]
MFAARRLVVSQPALYAAAPRAQASRLTAAAAAAQSTRRSYVTSPLQPDPSARPAAADVVVKPGADKRPFAPPAERDETQGELGQVKMPDMESLGQRSEGRNEVKIPTAPDTYRTSSASSPDANGAATPPEPAPHAPHFATAAHPSTYPGGGPSQNRAGQESDVVLDHSSAQKHRGGGGSSSSSGQEKYEWSDRPLNADERRGLLVLGGIVAGGLFLGTVTQPGSLRRSSQAA